MVSGRSPVIVPRSPVNSKYFALFIDEYVDTCTRNRAAPSGTGQVTVNDVGERSMANGRNVGNAVAAFTGPLSAIPTSSAAATNAPRNFDLTAKRVWPRP